MILELGGRRRQVRALRDTEGRLVLVDVAELGNTAGDLSDSIGEAARELGDRASGFFFEKVREELPGILQANDPELRAIVAGSIKAALADSHVDERLAQAEDKIRTGLVVASAATAIGAAVLTLLLAKAFA